LASYAGGYAIWLAYGLSTGGIPLIVVDTVGLLCGGLMLASPCPSATRLSAQPPRPAATRLQDPAGAPVTASGRIHLHIALNSPRLERRPADCRSRASPGCAARRVNGTGLRLVSSGVGAPQRS